MDATPFAIGKLLTTLLDRPVQMVRAEEPAFSTKLLFATYDVQPDEHLAVVKLDFALLASLAGILIGLPAKQVEAQVSKATLDEDMTDAAREVMNVFSSLLAGEGRAVLRRLCLRETELHGNEKLLLVKGGLSRTSLRCTVSAQTAGFMTIVSTA